MVLNHVSTAYIPGDRGDTVFVFGFLGRLRSCGSVIFSFLRGFLLLCGCTGVLSLRCTGVWHKVL